MKKFKSTKGVTPKAATGARGLGNAKSLRSKSAAATTSSCKGVGTDRKPRSKAAKSARTEAAKSTSAKASKKTSKVKRGKKAPLRLRLDLGCGANVHPGFEGVDLHASGCKWKLDLLEFPWPWSDGEVDELHCSHYIEHIPATCGPDGRDLLVAFMDEAWRVLKPGGIITIVVPNARSNRAFQDPTHRRFIVSETFLYFNAEWKESNGLSHYLGVADFDIDVRMSCPPEMFDLSESERNRRFESHWNAIWDWFVVLTKRPLS